MFCVFVREKDLLYLACQEVDFSRFVAVLSSSHVRPWSGMVNGEIASRGLWGFDLEVWASCVLGIRG